MASQNRASDLVEIGWREWLALPDLNVPGIKAKVDTGARSSALHTASYDCFEDAEGQWQVRFQLNPLKKRKDCLRKCQAKILTFREVKDSSGHIENRPFIETRIRMGKSEWSIELSLTNRERMRFRMLLGRTAIKQRFTVNPARSYCLGKKMRLCYED